VPAVFAHELAARPAELETLDERPISRVLRRSQDLLAGLSATGLKALVESDRSAKPHSDRTERSRNSKAGLWRWNVSLVAPLALVDESERLGGREHELRLARRHTKSVN
jgi:hypothetical protein